MDFVVSNGILHTCVLSCFSRVQLFKTPWTVARQAPLSMGFSRQEYWSGLPCPPPGDLPDLGIEPTSSVSPALAGGVFTTSAILEVHYMGWVCVSHSVVSNSWWPHGLQPARLLSQWDSPGKNTGVGYHALLRGIFPTRGSNLHFLRLLYCRQILY